MRGLGLGLWQVRRLGLGSWQVRGLVIIISDLDYLIYIQKSCFVDLAYMLSYSCVIGCRIVFFF